MHQEASKNPDQTLQLLIDEIGQSLIYVQATLPSSSTLAEFAQLKTQARPME